MYFRLGSDWSKICNAIKLVEGYAVKLIVTEAKDNTVVTLQYVPLQCIHRTQIRPEYNIS